MKEIRGHIFVVSGEGFPCNGEECDKGHEGRMIVSQRNNENQDPKQVLEEALSCRNNEYHPLKIETLIAEVGWSDKDSRIDRAPNGKS